MSFWPFKGSSEVLEHRAEGDASYTDVLVNALQAMASGREARPTATGALEACAGFVWPGLSRARWWMAQVTPWMP